MSNTPLRLPRELLPVAQEIRKQIRLSRNGYPRVYSWFNVNTGREHFWLLRKSKEYEVYGHFRSLSELIAFCNRYHFDTVDITEIAYESKTKTLADLKAGL